MPVKSDSYKCDFCNRHLNTMPSAKRHELRNCRYNKSRKMCNNCKYYDDCIGNGVDEMRHPNQNNKCDEFKNKHSLTTDVPDHPISETHKEINDEMV